MSNKNGIITAPISVINDVANILNVSSGDDATLCTSDRINRFALFAPRYSLSNPGLELNETGFTEIAGNVSQKPAGDYGCPAYGVWVPKYNIGSLTQSNLSTLFDSSRKEWYIARPDANSFKNIAHFDGYNHRARVANPVISASVSKNTKDGGYSLNMVFTAPAPDGSTMSVSNLFGGKGWYFGAIVLRGTDENGWQPSDTRLVAGTTTAISGTSSTTVELKINDTGANADSSVIYYYRVIPFVSNRSGLNSGNTIDTTFYGLRISSDFKAWMEIKTGGTSTGSGEERINYFNFKEGSNGNYYPDENHTQYPANQFGGSITPDIAVAYSEDYDSLHYKSLLDKYSRIDMVFTVYSSGSPMEITYTWRKTGSDPDDNVLTRDGRYDNTNVNDKLLFYIPAGNFFAVIQAMTGSADISISDMYGRFHYKDHLGYDHVDEAFATYIPDIDGN